jgi:hypothetical protein
MLAASLAGRGGELGQNMHNSQMQAAGEAFEFDVEGRWVTGGAVHDTAGNAVDISGNASILITGVGISSIQTGQSEDGVRVSGNGNVTLTGLSLIQVRDTAIRVMREFTGELSWVWQRVT